MSQGRCSLSLSEGLCSALRSPRLLHAARGSSKFPCSSLTVGSPSSHVPSTNIWSPSASFIQKSIRLTCLSTFIFRYILWNNLIYSIFINVTLYKIYNTFPNVVRLFVIKAALNNQIVHGKYLDSCLYILSHKTNQQQSWEQNLGLLVSNLSLLLGLMPPVQHFASGNNMHIMLTELTVGVASE